MGNNFWQVLITALMTAALAGAMAYWTATSRLTYVQAEINKELAQRQQEETEDIAELRQELAIQIGKMQGEVSAALAQDDEVGRALDRFSQRLNLFGSATIDQEGRLGWLEGRFGLTTPRKDVNLDPLLEPLRPTTPETSPDPAPATPVPPPSMPH